MTRSLLRYFPLFIFTKTFYFIFAILFILFSFFYLYQVGQIASQGYKIKMSQERVSAMTLEGEELETDFIKARSAGNLESLVKGLNFEDIDQIYYIKSSGGPVVSK